MLEQEEDEGQQTSCQQCNKNLQFMFAKIWSIRPEVSHKAITFSNFISTTNRSRTRNDFVKSVSSWSGVWITRLLLKKLMLSLWHESISPVIKFGCFNLSSRLYFCSQLSQRFVPPSTVILNDAESKQCAFECFFHDSWIILTVIPQAFDEIFVSIYWPIQHNDSKVSSTFNLITIQECFRSPNLCSGHVTQKWLKILLHWTHCCCC